MPKSSQTRLILSVLICLLLPSALIAGDKQFHVQGRLLDGSGAPLVGTPAVTFSLYQDPGGGAPAWQETRTLVLSSGLFNVPLGQSATLDNLLFDRPYYLGVKVGGDPELTPRQPLAATAYALGSLGDFHAAKNLSVAGRMEVQGPVKLAPANSTDNASPALVGLLGDDFGYSGQYLNQYAFGFYHYNEGQGPGMNAYVSGFYGVDLFTGGQSRLRIGSDGRMGAGTAAPNGLLHLAAPSDQLLLEETEAPANAKKWLLRADGSRLDLVLANDAWSDWTVALGVQRSGLAVQNVTVPAGNVGIGVVNPGVKLDVAGTVRGNVFTLSDRGLKKNIQAVPRGTLGKVMRLKGVSFEWDRKKTKNALAPLPPALLAKSRQYSGGIAGKEDKGFPAGPQIGLVAQDVEAVFPQLVHTDGKGVKSISSMGVTALLLEALKEQQTQIETLKTRIKALEQKK